MFKKSIVVAFLSIFVAFPAFAETQICTADLPNDPQKRTWQVWFKTVNYLPCNPGASNYVVSDQTLTRDWHTSSRWRFSTPFDHVTVTFTLETYSSEGWFVKKDCIEDSIPFTQTFQRFNMVNHRHRDNYTYSSYRVALIVKAEIRPFPSYLGNDRTPIKIICSPPPDDDDDDECPNLNLTIRGTLLPARRGTARVSGDWCH